MENNNTQPSPESIMQIGFGFWPSKILLTAVNFKLFTLLAEKKKLSAEEIKTTPLWRKRSIQNQRTRALAQACRVG